MRLAVYSYCRNLETSLASETDFSQEFSREHTNHGADFDLVLIALRACRNHQKISFKPS